MVESFEGIVTSSLIKRSDVLMKIQLLAKDGDVECLSAYVGTKQNNKQRIQETATPISSAITSNGLLTEGMT